MHTQSCPTLGDPMDCSPQVSSVHGILQARMLEWIAFSFSRGSSWPRDWTHVSYSLYWQADSLPAEPLGEAMWKSLSCLTLCNPMDYTGHGILQARILEWVAYPFASKSSWSRNWTRVFCIAGRFFTNWATKFVKLYKIYINFVFCQLQYAIAMSLKYQQWLFSCFLLKLALRGICFRNKKKNTFSCRVVISSCRWLGWNWHWD